MSSARKLNNVTLADIREVLGQTGKKSNDNWLFQCPICQDNSCDNLIVKGNGAYIHCFSCVNNEGGKYVLKEIERIRAEKREKEQQKNLVKKMKTDFRNEMVQTRYIEYMVACNDYLMENDELLNLLYEKRGIDKQTVIDCGIGFDEEKQEWVLPLFSLSSRYSCQIMGFEFRRKMFDKYSSGSKVRRTSGYISDICPVYGCNQAKTLYIMEGFWDSYCMRQYLRNRGEADREYTIYSCSNGVSSLLNVLNRIDFSKFSEIKLILDADKAGDEVTDKIIDEYVFIQDKRAFLYKSDCKDFNEWYLATQEGR